MFSLTEHLLWNYKLNCGSVMLETAKFPLILSRFSVAAEILLLDTLQTAKTDFT